MSDDVIVLGRDQRRRQGARRRPAMPLTVDIEADLGDAFRLRGMGIDAELAGTVRVRTGDDRAPRVNGTIRAVSGNYAAYGQKLAIERGVLDLQRPLRQPGAEHPRGAQASGRRAAVRDQCRSRRGSARHGAGAGGASWCRRRSVPDSEKLSWLVLGHGMEGTSGNEAGVLSAAAGALLGGSGRRLPVAPCQLAGRGRTGPVAGARGWRAPWSRSASGSRRAPT